MNPDEQRKIWIWVLRLSIVFEGVCLILFFGTTTDILKFAIMGFSLVFFILAVLCFSQIRILDGHFEEFVTKNTLENKKKKERREKQREEIARKESIRNAAEFERKKKIDLAQSLWDKGGLENLQQALNIYLKYNYDMKKLEADIAKEKEKHLDYDGAIADFEKLGLHKSARRIRRKKMNDAKVEQTIVHGDYVDDRDTIVKDSVINRSNIGADGKSKGEEIKEIKELLDSGAIDDDEFKQMKKEILGK